MALCFGDFVVAVLLPADVYLRLRESGVWVDVEQRERVGNRGGGNIRRLCVCGLGEIHISSFRRVHSMDRARVSTLAQKNDSASLTVESAGTNETIADHIRIIGLENVGDLAACFLRIVLSVPALVRWSRFGVPGHLERSGDAPCIGKQNGHDQQNDYKHEFQFRKEGDSRPAGVGVFILLSSWRGIKAAPTFRI